MPYSKNQVIAARIAEHAPEKLHARNRGMLSMSREEMHKLASASTKGLPKKVKHIGKHARGKK